MACLVSSEPKRKKNDNEEHAHEANVCGGFAVFGLMGAARGVDEGK